ncbi:hypothetical protein, partial [Albidovulum sp.]|uniref:hypothetical protein n=1 Tax=Albidovulum sp. TaxID=1872424 RepID=UPI0039B874AB
DLAVNLPSPRALPLSDPNRRCDRNTKSLRRGPNRLTIPQRRRNPHPQSIESGATILHPHCLVVTVKHITINRGILFQIQSSADTL